VVPSYVKLTSKPGFDHITAPSLLDWFISAVTLRHVWASPNTVWSLIAVAMYFGVPYNLGPGSAAAQAPFSSAFFAERFPLWALVTFGYTAFWHVTLYYLHWAERPFLPKRVYRLSKVAHNMAYSLSGVAIWVGFENVFAFLWATDRLPYLTNAQAFSTQWGLLNFLAGIALIPVWRDAHFYFAHRFLHYKPMYNQVHSLHHRNTDIEPFSGLCMHPIEHLYYYSCILPNLLVFCSPLHLLWNGVHLLIAPAAGHSGFEDHFQADTFHYLHHRTYECNYAGGGASALDVFFGTFKSRMDEAESDRVPEERADEKSTIFGLPSLEYVLYMVGACGCVVAWGLACCWEGAGPVGEALRGALGPVPPALTTPTGHAAMALLAGFGPVVVGCAMAPAGYFGECATAFVSSKPEVRGEMLAATFHIIVGTLFCSVPIALGCHMAY
jgi:sterol desaturase/sphingolipid hydroxylase (fatty acid hydroxylase superfamily)